MKASVLTLVLTATMFCAQLAQGQILLGNGAAVASKSVSSKSTLAAMMAAGSRYHAAANYRDEHLVTATKPVRPDDRAGRRGV